MHYCPHQHEITPTAPGKITTYLATQPNTCKLANLSLFVLKFSITVSHYAAQEECLAMLGTNDIRRVKSKVRFSTSPTWFEVLEEAARRISSPIISKEKERINQFCLRKGSMWVN